MNATARAALAADIAAAFPAIDEAAGLAELVDGCNNPGVARNLLRIDLGTLPAAMARLPFLQLIAGALEPMLMLDRARLFALADGNLFLAWRGDGGTAEENALHLLARLFADLPGANGQPACVYALPADRQIVSALIEEADLAPAPPPLADAAPLTPHLLEQTEAMLGQADLAGFIRRIPICGWVQGSAPQLRWERRAIDLRALADALAADGKPSLDLTRDPWLARRLSRTLDRRLLALLGDARALAAAPPFALRLNVASILAPDFLRFDAALPPALRGRLIVEITLADAVADLACYGFARDFLRARQHRIMLSGLNRLTLELLGADLLGADLVGLSAASLHAHILPPGLSAECVVLQAADTVPLIETGWRHGISLFEGRAARPVWPTRPGQSAASAMTRRAMVLPT